MFSTKIASLAQEKANALKKDLIDRSENLSKILDALNNLLMDADFQKMLKTFQLHINLNSVSRNLWSPKIYFDKNAIGFRFRIPQLLNGKQPHQSHGQDLYDFIYPVLINTHLFLDMHSKKFPIKIWRIEKFLKEDSEIVRDGKTLYQINPARITDHITHPRYRYYDNESKLIDQSGYLSSFELLFQLR